MRTIKVATALALASFVATSSPQPIPSFAALQPAGSVSIGDPREVIPELSAKVPSLESLRIPKTTGQVAPAPPGESGNGPWAVRVVLRTSKNGTSFTGRQEIMDQAGVPNLLVTSNGTTYAYFQDWANGNIMSVAVRAPKAKAWKYYKLHFSGINTVAKPNGVDPSAVELSDGRIRLYWMQRKDGNRIFSATSAKGKGNGVIFKFDGKFALDYPVGIYDPTVVKTDSGWAMWTGSNSGDVPVYATSKNGLNFKVQSGNPLFSEQKTFPWGAARMPSGEIRVIASILGPGGASGVILSSTDGGKSFKELSRGNIPSTSGGDSAIAYDPKAKTWYQLLSERMD